MANTLNLGSGNWGAKDSLLLGYYEDGGKFFPETFDVTRATGGTRVNKNGLIETPAEIGSEEITNGNFATDSDWTENGSTLPYMTILGGVLNSNNTNSGSWFAEYISQDVSFVNTKVYLVTLKARSISGAASFRITQNANIIITNNLTTEWVDYSATYTANADNGSIRFFINNAVGQFEIDNVSVKEYNDKNLARIDYLDDAKGVLLTEPQSTNLITQSELFSNSSWTKNNSSVTSGFSSPDGANNAFNLNISISSGYLLTQLFSYSAVLGQSITASIFAKNEITNFLSFGGATVSGTDIYSIQDYGNGWFRHIVTRTFTTTATGSVQFIIFNQVGNNVIWGAQLEQQSYSTSYIPTEGSTVTRNADLVTNGGDVNSFNSEEGVLFVETEHIYGASNTLISISGGSNSDYVALFFNPSLGLLARYYSGGSLQGNLSYPSISLNAFNKISFKYKENNFSLWVNGTEVATDTSGNTSSVEFNKINFASPTDSSKFLGKTKNVQVFNEALSDSDLLSLTTTGSVPYWTQYSAMATTLNYTNK